MSVRLLAHDDLIIIDFKTTTTATTSAFLLNLHGGRDENSVEQRQPMGSLNMNERQLLSSTEWRKEPGPTNFAPYLGGPGLYVV